MTLIFKQIAKLTTKYKDLIEENRYELTFSVTPKGDTEKSSVVYDRELGIYIENKNLATYLFEIEISEARLDLCKRLKKSQNFNRKLFYRYDFMQLKVNSQGRFVSILNKPELKSTWARLKERMLIDHKGNYVEKYLDRIDLEFVETDKFYSSFRQYLYFGLLFPYIPKTHSPNWEGKRVVLFSPYEKEKFEEYTTVSSFEDTDIIYDITGSTLPDSNTQILKYEGYITKGINEIFPTRVQLQTAIIKDNITIEWEFDLYKYKTLKDE